MILFMGCSSAPSLVSDEVVLPQAALARGTASILGAAGDGPVALGAVVRVTYDVAVLLASVTDDVAGPFRVQLPGDAPVAAHVLGRKGGVLVLGVARSGRDLRPLELAPEPPSPMAPALYLPARGIPLSPLACGIAADPPSGKARAPGIAWLAPLAPSSDDDERTVEARAAQAEGGLVFDRQLRLLGFIGRSEKGAASLLVATSAVPSVEDAILMPPGADLVRPDDALLCYAVRAERLLDFPRCTDEDGSGPMLALELRVAGELVGRVEVGNGTQADLGRSVLVVTKAVGPISVQLVALDRNLAQGETRVELSAPATFFALAPKLDMSLELKPESLVRYPHARSRIPARARLAFEPVDPDRQSGLRRSPILPAAIALGRPFEGTLDLPGGQATEFLTVTDAAAEDVVGVLYRRRRCGRVELRIFAPNAETDLLSLAVEERGPHLALATGSLLKGRVLVRLRQLSGSAAVPYEVLIASRNDASGLVGPLFRLVNREAGKDATAFMDSDAFVEEVAEALEKTTLPHDALCRAILDELGGRIQVSRRLAFCLLEQHFIPTRQLLEEVFATGGPSSQDAGLILAELDPREPRIRPVLRRACGDADSYVRARAVRAAARGGDAAFAEEIAALVADDPAPIVERAAATARLNAALLRQNR